MALDEMLGMPPGMAPAVGFGGMPRMPVPQRPLNPYQRLREIGYMTRMARMGMPMGRGTNYNPGRMPGMLDTSTGFNPDVADTGAMNQLLQGFGQHMPENPSPYAMLPNSGFFGQHQKLGGALEGGLFGAANTPSAQTWGEGINAVARGILGGTAERARAINQQYSQPFQQAGQVGQLMQMQQMMKLEQARAEQQGALAQKDLRQPTQKYQHIFPDIGGKKAYGVKPDGSIDTIDFPDEANINKPTTQKNNYGGAPASLWGQLASMKDDNGDPLDPTKKPDPKYINRANAQILADKLRVAVASATTRDEADMARLQVSQTHADRHAAALNEVIPKNAGREVLRSRFPELKDANGDWRAPTPDEIGEKNRSIWRSYGLNVDGTDIYGGNPPSARSMMPTKTPSKPKGTWNPVTGRYE